MKNKSGNSGAGTGIGFVGLLQIAFIVLKLCKTINWSWLWVMSPLWISILIIIAVVSVMILTILIVDIVEKIKDKKK